MANLDGQLFIGQHKVARFDEKKKDQGIIA